MLLLIETPLILMENEDGPPSFLDFPPELRNSVYDSVLVRQGVIEPILIYIRDNGQLAYSCNSITLTPGLFRVNNVIYREVSSAFYAQNISDLQCLSSVGLDRFFESIGHDNASHKQHVCLKFPDFDPPLYTRQEQELLSVDAASIREIASIRNNCINVRTLKMIAERTCSYMAALANIGDQKTVSDAVALLDSHFRMIPSLQNNVVEYLGIRNNRNAYVEREMERHGWTIEVAQPQWPIWRNEQH